MKMATFLNPEFFKSWSKIYNKDKDLSPRLAYKAKSINDYLNDQNAKFNELRQAIINKYGNKDEKGTLVVKEGIVEFKPETIGEVNKEFAELTQLELEPTPPGRLKIDELEDPRNDVKLSGPDVALLSELLDFGDEKKPNLSVVPNPSN